MNFLRILFILFMGATLLVQPTLVQAQKVAVEASVEDQAIQKRVRELFSQIEDFNNVFVSVTGGVVTMKGRVLELDQVSRAQELASKIEGVVTVNNLIEVETSVERRLAPILERFSNRLAQFVAFLPIVAIGLLVLIAFGVAGHLIAKLQYPWDALAPNRFIANLIRQVVRLGFLIAGIVLALDIMGATALLGTILGAAGIFGLAIGFAVRDTVENYIASILLSVRQPFRPRDVVKIEGYEGHVIALTSRATILLTFDGNHVRIPNATVFKSAITNYSLNPERRFDFELGVETDDLQRAVELGLEVIGGLSFVLKDPAPDGWLQRMGDSNVVIWFGGWINQNETSLVKARAEAIRLIRQAYAAEGIELPEPTYRVKVDGVAAWGGATPKPKPVTKSSPSRASKKAAPAIAEEQDVSPDRNLERKIAVEEHLAKSEDLLDADRPREHG